METFDRYGDLLVFVRVAELGGFGRAAAALGVSTSHASRALARLEERLGAQLLRRTTRRVTLTDAGRALLGRAGPLLAELDAAQEDLRSCGGEPRGTLRVSLPVYFGVHFIAPLAAEFACQHEGLNVELVFEDRRVDLLADGFDLAVRLGALADSSLIARRLGRTQGLTVASDAYLQRRGIPQHPRDLASHEVVLYAYDVAGPTWRFPGPEGEVLVRVSGRFAANSGEAGLAAAVAGLGVAGVPEFMAAAELRAGRVRRVLAGWEREIPIAAVYPPSRQLAPRVRLFVDLLAARLADAPWLREDREDTPDLAR